MKAGDLIKWYPSWVDPGSSMSELGLVVEKIKDGWIVLWANGNIEVFPQHLGKDTEVIYERRRHG